MLEKLLKKLETAEAESNRMDSVYEADPENRENEIAWLEAYNAAFDAHEEVVKFLMEVLRANGMKDIDRSTVNKMIAEHRDQLTTIAASI